MLTWLQRPSVQVRLWSVFTIVWIVMTPVTLVTALAHSIPWLNFLSLFANTASCGTAAVAALAYHRAANADQKADHVIEHSPHIPAIPDRT